MSKKYTIFVAFLMGWLLISGMSGVFAQQNKNTPNVPGVLKSIQQQPLLNQETNRVRVQNEGAATSIETQLQEQSQVQNVASPNPSPKTSTNRASKSLNPHSETAREHMSIVAQKVEELLSATTTEITGIGAQVREIARTQKETQKQIEEQIQNIQSRPQWLKAIFGPAYNSIEKAKRYLETTQLRIQQLEQIMNQLQNEGEKQIVQEMINALVQQQTALENYLQNEEGVQSLLGKILRFFFRKKTEQPTPSPTSTITPTLSPTPTSEPSPTPTPTPTESPTESPTPEPTPTE